MVLSSQEIKKQIIFSILEFSLDVESHKKTGEHSLVQISEMLSLAIEISNLINSLDKPDKNVNKPNLITDDLRKMKRVLELVFKYKSDLNSISIDIGENLSSTNRLLQKGIDYIFENLSTKDFRHIQRPIKQGSTVKKPTVVKPRQPQSPKPKKSLGLIAPLMFLIVLVGAGMAVYNFFFNSSATTVASLVKEYRSDTKLSLEAKPSLSKNLKVGGTFSLLSVMKSHQEFFTSRHPEIKLEITSEDSSDAIRDVIEKRIDLAASSRIPTVDERKKALNLSNPIADHKIALDSVVVFTHKSNPIDVLSLNDLKKIYHTELITWKEASAHNPSPTTISRFLLSKASGTYAFFVDRVMFGESISGKIIHIYDPLQMIELVSQNPNSIGITSLSAVLESDAVNRLPGIKVIKIASDLNESGTKPVTDSGTIDVSLIQRGEYPLTRYLYLVSAGELTENVANFIDFARSPEIQTKLNAYGLVGIN